MIGQTTNPLLQKTEAGIMAKVKPELKEPLQRTVSAGMEIMYGSKNDMLKQQLSKSPDFAHNVGEGAAKLMAILFQQSKNTMPMEIAVPASIIFMCEGLDFLEKAGKIEVTPDLLAEATQDTSASVLQLLGITPEKMQQMTAQKQGAALAPTDAAPPATGAQPAAGGIINAARGG